MTNEDFIESIRLDGEEWRNVVGYEGLYLVSNHGRVISCGRKVFNGKGYGYKEPILMRQTELVSKKCRYYTVSLSGVGKPKRKLVHRIEMEAFVENPNRYSDIDHIDRNGKNNRIENLRWCTRKMNMANEGTRKVLSVCHDNHDGSYRWRPVVQILDGKIVNRYKSITSTSKNGFNPTIVTHVCRGEKKTHKGYSWMYLSEYEKLIND